MGDKLEYDVVFADRGTDTLSKAAAGLRSMDAAAGKAARTSVDLADAQIKVRQAMNNVRGAESTLAAARAKLTKVTADATATDEQRTKAAVALEAAELKHARTLLGVQKAGEAAARASRRIGEEAQDGEGKATKAYAGISKAIGALGKVAGGAAKGLAVGTLAAGVLAGAALSQGIATTLDTTAARAKLVAQLDLSAKDAERIGKLAGDLYANNYGDSLDTVNQAIRSVITSGSVLKGTSSRDLGDVASRALNVAQVFDQDVNGVLRATGQLMRTGLAKDGKQALDLLTRAYQTGTDNAEDLIESVVEYGTQLRKVGIDGPRAIGLVNQGLRAGARDSDTVLDAVKEFSIRSVEGSKTSRAAYKLLGLDAKALEAQISKGGKSATTAFGTVLDALRKMKPGVDFNTAAFGLFGTKSDDLGAALLALDPGAATLGKVAGATDRLNTALADDPGQKLERIKRVLEDKVTTWLVDAFEWFQDNWPELALGAISLARSMVNLIGPLSGVAAGAAWVGAALLAGASAAAYAKGNIALGRELWGMAGVLKESAGKAVEMGRAIQEKANPALDALEGKVNDAKAAMDGLPSKKTTTVDAPGATGAARKMDAATRAANGIPARKNTRVTADDLASAKAARIQRAIRGISPNRHVVVQVTSRGVEMVQRNINAITGKVVSIQVGRVGVGPGANADGTPFWRGGPTWVGERGPELMDLPRGTRIWDAITSKSMAADRTSSVHPAAYAPAGGGPAVTLNVAVNLNGPVTGTAKRFAQQVAPEMLAALRQQLRDVGQPARLG